MRTGIFFYYQKGERLRDFPQALKGILEQENLFLYDAFYPTKPTSSFELEPISSETLYLVHSYELVEDVRKTGNFEGALFSAAWYQTTFPPTPVDVKFNSPEELLMIGGQKIICLHTPGHTPGSICIYLDRDGKRVLFAQDLHGPLLEEFGSNLGDWDRSTKKLLDLDADILCEGHSGIYKTKKDVKNYILSYRRQYGVE